MPRVVLVPGVGLFGARRTARRTPRSPPTSPRPRSRSITDAEAARPLSSRIPEADLFDIEYWSLEQAKLGRRGREAAGRRRSPSSPAAPAPSARRRRAAFAAEGAEVGGARLDDGRPGGCKGSVRGLGLACDVTDPAQVRAAFDRIAATYRRRRHRRLQRRRRLAGPDRRGRRRDAAPELRAQFLRPSDAWRRTPCASCCAQGTGGCLLFNVSKQAVNPGPRFRALRPAQGRDAVPDAPIRARIRRRRHPLQRGQRRPHPQRAC